MSDLPPFEPRNDLEGLLMRAAAEPAARPAFTRALLEATLYAPAGGDELLPIENGVLPEGARVGLLMAALEDGRNATAVFTDESRIGEVYGAGQRLLSMKGRDLLEMVASNPVALNPWLAYGVVFEPADIAAMLGRERVIERDTQILLGHPKERPDDLLARLGAVFQPVAEVEQAWLALAQWTGRGEVAWYLDIRSDAPRERLVALLDQALDGADFRGLMLDMAVNPTGAGEGAGIAVLDR